ncbi:MAG: hypothetical protein MZV65_30440 [Chromatiales bacterium]|nr:hypothetical protein [Chromatiales bacterium]
MNAGGVLPAYLPEFGHIVSRMQYDLFRAYAVDQHILFVVRNLRRFFLPQYRPQAACSQCSAIMERRPQTGTAVHRRSVPRHRQGTRRRSLRTGGPGCRAASAASTA